MKVTVLLLIVKAEVFSGNKFVENRDRLKRTGFQESALGPLWKYRSGPRQSTNDNYQANEWDCDNVITPIPDSITKTIQTKQRTQTG